MASSGCTKSPVDGGASSAISHLDRTSIDHTVHQSSGDRHEIVKRHSDASSGMHATVDAEQGEPRTRAAAGDSLAKCKPLLSLSAHLKPRRAPAADMRPRVFAPHVHFRPSVDPKTICSSNSSGKEMLIAMDRGLLDRTIDVRQRGSMTQPLAWLSFIHSYMCRLEQSEAVHQTLAALVSPRRGFLLSQYGVDVGSVADREHKWKYGVGLCEQIMASITYLNLESRMLHDVGDIPSCFRLRILILGDNHIASLAPLSSCACVELLDVHRNKLTSIPSDVCRAMPNLKLLYAHDNCIANIAAVAGLVDCHSLCALTLADTPFALGGAAYRSRVSLQLRQLLALDGFLLTAERSGVDVDNEVMTILKVDCSLRKVLGDATTVRDGVDDIDAICEQLRDDAMTAAEFLRCRSMVKAESCEMDTVRLSDERRNSPSSFLLTRRELWCCRYFERQAPLSMWNHSPIAQDDDCELDQPATTFRLPDAIYADRSIGNIGQLVNKTPWKPPRGGRRRLDTTRSSRLLRAVNFGSLHQVFHQSAISESPANGEGVQRQLPGRDRDERNAYRMKRRLESAQELSERRKRRLRVRQSHEPAFRDCLLRAWQFATPMQLKQINNKELFKAHRYRCAHRKEERDRVRIEAALFEVQRYKILHDVRQAERAKNLCIIAAKSNVAN